MAASVPFPKRMQAAPRVRPPHLESERAGSSMRSMTPPQSGREWRNSLAGRTPPLSGLRAMSSSPVPSSAMRSDGSLSPMPPMHPRYSSTATPPYGIPMLEVPMLLSGADQAQQRLPPVANPAWTDEDAKLKAAAYVRPPSTPRSHWNHQNTKSADSCQQEQQQQKQQQRLPLSNREVAATAEGLCPFTFRAGCPPPPTCHDVCAAKAEGRNGRTKRSTSGLAGEWTCAAICMPRSGSQHVSLRLTMVTCAFSGLVPRATSTRRPSPWTTREYDQRGCVSVWTCRWLQWRRNGSVFSKRLCS